MAKTPTVNVIYDSRRIEKYEHLVGELKRQRINYVIWPCLIYSTVVRSINSSHKMIVKEAKEKGLIECCIAEDDILFPHEKGWEWFLKNKPKVYDLYVAGSYFPFEKTAKEGAIRVNGITGFHLYFVHSRYYDEFLATPDDHHIDTSQKSNLMYLCYPMAAIQRPGFSANNKVECNYNSTLRDEDVYGGKPK